MFDLKSYAPTLELSSKGVVGVITVLLRDLFTRDYTLSDVNYELEGHSVDISVYEDGLGKKKIPGKASLFLPYHSLPKLESFVDL